MANPTPVATIEKYARAWNEPDEALRRGLLDDAWSERGRYTDPAADVVGRDALVRHIVGFQQRFPGTRIELASGIDSHHHAVRFAWRMIGPDGAVTVEGMDFGELGADGRLERIVGFFGPFPALAKD